MTRLALQALYFALAAPLAGAGAARPPQATSLTQFDPLNEVRIDQRLGEQLPLDARFLDEHGEEVRLGRYFGARPVVLALVYYECPMLCNLVLNGLVSALDTIELEPGADFELVAISIDPAETSELARRKEATYLELYGRPESAAGWHFLVGQEESIRAVADAVGFRYFYDPGIDEYAHASGIVIATPSGELARYFYGITYEGRDLRLGLVESSEGRIGGPVEQFLLLCFHYDPTTGKYGFAVMSALRLAGILTVGLIGFSLFTMLRRERARAARHAGGADGVAGG